MFTFSTKFDKIIQVMTTKIRAYLISAAILIVSLVMMLIFVLPKGNDPAPWTPFSFVTKNLTMEAGEMISPFYQSSHDDITISYVVDKENIVEINLENKSIRALNSGAVKVTLEVEYDGNIYKYSFNVSVLKSSQTLEIVPISNCTFENNILQISSGVQSCQFSIKLYGTDSQLIVNPKVSVSVTSGSSIVERFGGYQFVANDNVEGTIAFVFEELGFEYAIKFIKN